ncbi:MAG: hypothetical protein HRT37_01240 [Alteromonadaceae bacterium]|nr:hypothetical protein [Alteromonadaceae bacterium]
MLVVEINNIRFDDNNENCSIQYFRTQGYLFAFVQALDLGRIDLRLKKPKPKRYWGLWDNNEPEKSMLNIFRNGSRWPSLPK